MQRETQIFTEVQTRSDTENGKWMGTHTHSSVLAAYNAWKEDPSIWKISFFPADADPFPNESLEDFCQRKVDTYRFLVKHHSTNDIWSEDSEAKLALLNPAYSQAKPTDIFWVNQKIMPDDIDLLQQQRRDGLITATEFGRRFALGCIEEVLTDLQFQAKYCG